MALKPEEVKRIEGLSDEMAKLIENRDNTSNEAAVVYSKIGKACTAALAKEAGAAAKRNARAAKISQFQAARQARQKQKTSAQNSASQTRKQA